MSVVNHLVELDAVKNLPCVETGPATPHLQIPYSYSYETCVLFADVSGFTALCEAMSMQFPRGGGEEFLAKHLNSYFELLVRTLSSQGGDVFKFAGDALLVSLESALEVILDNYAISFRPILLAVEKCRQCHLDTRSSTDTVPRFHFSPFLGYLAAHKRRYSRRCPPRHPVCARD